MSRIVIGIAAIGVLGAADPAAAADIYVPDDHASVQGAIDAASDGDTIFIRPGGTYHEVLDTQGKAIHLFGEESSPGAGDFPVIDGSGKEDSVLTIDDGEDWNTVIENLVLTGGEGRLMSGRRVGGGVRVHSAGATFRNVEFRGNTANTGAGAAVNGSLVMFVDCTFRGNAASLIIHNGGAGLYSHTSTVVLANTRFLENTAHDTYGAAIAGYSGTLILINSIVSGNTGSIGGALYQNAGSLELHNVAVHDNHSSYTGAGVTLQNGVELVVTNSIFDGNVNPDAVSFRPGEIVRMAGVDEADLSVRHSLLTPGSHPADEGFLHDCVFATPEYVSEANGSADFLKLASGSRGHDEGKDDLLPFDWVDFDGDGDFYEDLPKAMREGFDLPERSRGDRVDMGPFERDDAAAGGPAGCPDRGDFDGSGDVGFADLTVLLAEFGACSGDCGADLNGDGQVAFDDLLSMLMNWGACP